MVSPVRGDHRRFQAEIPLIVLSKFPEPAHFAIAPSQFGCLPHPFNAFRTNE
jgi:hypothetical protein